MNNREKKTATKKSKKRIFLTVLCVFLALILAALLAVTIYFESTMGLINRKDPSASGNYMTQEEWEKLQSENPDNTDDPVVDPDDVDWGDPATTIGAGKNVINILLIGQDKRPGESRARSDSMILCTINKEKKTLTMSSLMRDMYVQIPGYSDNRINASYAFGGMELLDQCIVTNFGVTVDGNVEVDFSGFQEIIDLVGGIDVELSQAEANYLNRWGNWDVEDNAGKWSLTAGVNHLNGSQATAYARIREVGNADFGRTNRQRTILNLLVEKARTMSATKINELLKAALPLLTTDLTDQQIMGFAIQFLKILPDLEISTQQIPADGAYYNASIRGMAVLVPDLEKNREILAGIMED